MASEAQTHESVIPVEEKVLPQREKTPISQRAKDLLAIVRSKMKGPNYNPQEALATMATFSDADKKVSVSKKPEAPEEPEKQRSINAEQMSYLDPHEVYQDAVAKLPEELSPQQAFDIVKQKVEQNQKPPQSEPVRNFNLIDKTRHTALSLEAKARGITDIEGFQKLVTYLETSVKPLDKKMAFNVGREHIPVLAKLLSIHKDPVMLISSLKESGFNLSENDLKPKQLNRSEEEIKLLGKSNIQYVEELTSLPNADQALSVLTGVKWVDGWTLSGYGGSPTQFDSFLNVMRDPVLATQLTPDTVSRIDILSQGFDRKILASQLPEYLKVVNNPDQFNTAITIAATGNSEIAGSVVATLQGMQDAGILEQVRVLCANKVDFKGKMYDSYSSSPRSPEDFVKKAQEILSDPSIKGFVTDVDKRKFVQLVATNANKASISFKDIADDLDRFDKKEQYAYVHRLIYGENATSDSDLAWNISESDYLLEKYSKPEFNDFLNSLKSGGYQPEAHHFYQHNYYSGGTSQSGRIGGTLDSVFYNRDMYKKIYSDPVPAMLESVIDREKIGFVEHVKDYPYLIDTLENLKKYGKVTDESMPALNNLINTANNPLIKKTLVDSIPESHRAAWFNSALELPPLARPAIEKLTAEKGFTQEALDQLVKVNVILKEVQESEYDRPGIQQALVDANYPGDIHDLFANGEPTFQFAKMLLDQKNYHTLHNVLSEKSLEGFDESVRGVLKDWTGLPEKLRNLTTEVFPGFPFLSSEEADKLQRAGLISESIDQSPSREMQRLKDDLLIQLWDIDDPTPALNQIRQVFELNNLPIAGKIFRVFEIIQSGKTPSGESVFATTLKMHPNTSEILRNASESQRLSLIYKDLIRMHIDSDNPSFRHYLEVLKDGDSLIAKIGTGDTISTLSSDEQLRLTYFLNKMDTLYANSLLGRRTESKKQKTGEDERLSTEQISPLDRIANLKKSFRLRDGQTFSDRVTEMFVKPVGLTTLEEVVGRMQSSKIAADQRNRKLVEEALATSGGVLHVKAGDVLKGTPERFLTQHLENGFGCPEVLGADSGKKSDMTPYDTDVSLVVNEDVTQGGIKDAIGKSLAAEYGDVILWVRNRGQFGGENGYDLFKTAPGGGEKHYGIRTGFASTEVDAIVLKDSFKKEDADRLFLKVAKNGFYIPVANAEGKVVFTPQMYDSYRKTFDGVEEFNGGSVEIRRTNPQDREYAQVQELVSQIAQEEPQVDHLSQSIRDVVQTVLAENNVRLRDQYDMGLYGADLLDTGSTGRHTNSPGDHDFDMMLLLDARDMARARDVAEAIKNRIGGTSEKESGDSEYIQIRQKAATGITSEETLDIDIGVAKRSDYDVFASHDAIAAKLSSIREQYGEDVAREVQANIVLTKKILKDGSAYKKQEHGGFGGIGVETWILGNGGSLRQAFETFYAAAVRNGETVPLDEFKEKYKIFDAGINLKFNSHDNYAQLLKPDGYNAMVKTIGNYLNG